MDPLLKVRDAAKQLNVNYKTIRRLISEGEILVIRTSEHTHGDRIEPSELESFMMRRRESREDTEDSAWLPSSAVTYGTSRSVSQDLDGTLDALLNQHKRKTLSH